MAKYRVVTSQDFDDIFEQKLGRNEYSVDVDEICVPLDRCVCATLGPVADGLIAELERKAYSQAPVQLGNDAGIGWRLVHIDALRNLAREPAPLSRDDAFFMASDTVAISSFTVSLSELLTAMEGKRAALMYVEGGPPPDWVQEPPTQESLSGDICGLLTVSDFNSRAVRQAFFELLYDLETLLAKFLRARVREDWDWIRRLRDEGKVRILGRWDLSRRQEVELNPIEAATLVDLLQVFGSTREFRAELGYMSGQEFERVRKNIADLRNRVMHPVRSLTNRPDDVGTLAKVVSVSLELMGRLRSILSSTQEVE